MKWILTIFLTMVLISLASAGVYQVSQSFDLIVSCSNLNCSNINITVLYPNSSVFINNEQMTNNNYYANYTLTPNTTGNYIYYYADENNSLSGEFKITSSGTSIDEGNSALIILGVGLFLILGILCFAGFFKATGNIGIKMPVKWTFFIFGFIFFLASVNLISATLPDALINPAVVSFFDTFTAISFYMFWFSFGILGVMWFLVFFQTILFKHKQTKLAKYGGG